MTYSSTLALSRNTYQSRNANRVRFMRSVPRIGPISNIFILIVLGCILCVFYLSQVTQTNVYGFKLNSLLQQQSSLKSEYANLQVTQAQLQSINNVSGSSATKSMVPISPSYTAVN